MAYVKKGKNMQMTVCDICQKAVRVVGLALHKRNKHGDLLKYSSNNLKAQLADVTAKLAAAEAKIKEFEVQKNPPTAESAALSDIDRRAYLSDWINSLTREAWEAIGQANSWEPLQPIGRGTESRLKADSGLKLVITRGK